MKKVILIEDMHGNIVVIENIERFYMSYALTTPDMPNPVISMELRNAINKFGIIQHFVYDDVEVVEYMPPHNIATLSIVAAEDAALKSYINSAVNEPILLKG